MTDFSIRVAVGQACTQAPQETHSDSRKSSSIPAATWEAKPLPSMVSAKVACTSSQARQCSTRSAGHGCPGLASARPDAIDDIIHLWTALPSVYAYSNKSVAN